jgi:hypothetical protein
MIQRLIDYRNDGEALYIYDYTDYTQTMHIYDPPYPTLQERGEMFSILFIRRKNTDEILGYYYNEFEFNSAESRWEADVPIGEDWGDEFIVDVFLFPVTNVNMISHVYAGDFLFIQETKSDYWRLYRLSGSTAPDEYVEYPIYDKLENQPSVGNDDWELIYDGETDTENVELDFDDLHQLLRQSGYSVVHEDGDLNKFFYDNVYHLSTGIELNEPDYPDNTYTDYQGDFYVEKKECNKYELFSNVSDVDTYDHVYLENLVTGEKIPLSFRVNIETGIGFPYSFSVPGDGIYGITVEYTLNDDTVITSDMVVVYEYCQFKKCYQKLAKDMYCSEMACCDSCDDDVRYEIERRMYELNKMHALFSQLLLVIHGHRVNYLMYNDSSQIGYNEFIASVKRLWYVIELTVNRCGSCDPQDNSMDNNPCNC